MKLRKFNENFEEHFEEDEPVNNVTIELTENEAKLLLLLLKDQADERADYGCNDPEPSEEKLFTKKERMNIARVLGQNEMDVEDMDGFLFNCDYPYYLRKKIKNQLK